MTLNDTKTVAQDIITGMRANSSSEPSHFVRFFFFLPLKTQKHHLARGFSILLLSPALCLVPESTFSSEFY